MFHKRILLSLPKARVCTSPYLCRHKQASVVESGVALEKESESVYGALDMFVLPDSFIHVPYGKRKGIVMYICFTPSGVSSW